MKPIKLIIKGLNSFETEQEIDFIKLTQNGFFGIFGPTGSGKSTILDGITLALYGEEARKSADFINVNGDKAYVKFWFQISGARVRRYLVDREFRRDAKTSGVRTGKCKLVDVTGQTTGDEVPLEILEETVAGINRRCQEIIGLTKEDFARTVVLPQGKFSEFLKMEGKQRRDMLERLFNLEDYGDRLRSRVNGAVGKLTTQQVRLEGELSGTGVVSQQMLLEIAQQIRTSEAELSRLEMDLAAAEADFAAKEVVYALRFELLEKGKALEAILGAAAEKDWLLDAGWTWTQGATEVGIAYGRKRLNAMQRASSVAELMEDHRRLVDREVTLNSEKIESQVALELARATFEVAQRDATEKMDAASTELPGIAVKVQQVSEAMVEHSAYQNLEAEHRSLVASEAALKAQTQSLEQELEAKRETLGATLQKIQDFEAQMAKLSVPAALKASILTGERLALSIQELSMRMADFDLRDQALALRMESGAGAVSKLDEEVSSMLAAKDLALGNLKTLEANPIEQASVDGLRLEYNLCVDKWRNYEKLQPQVHGGHEKVNGLELQIEGLQGEIKGAAGDYERASLNLSQIKTHNLAYEIRGSLESGDMCPVCGHLVDEGSPTLKSHMDLMVNAEALLKESEGALAALETQLSQLITELAVEKSRLAQNTLDLEALGTDFLGRPVSAVEADLLEMTRALASYSKDLAGAQATISEKEQALLRLGAKKERYLAELETIATERENRREEAKKDLEKLQAFQGEIKILEATTGISDFVEQARILAQKEADLEGLGGDLAQAKGDSAALGAEVEALRGQLGEAVAKAATVGALSSGKGAEALAARHRFLARMDAIGDFGDSALGGDFGAGSGFGAGPDEELQRLEGVKAKLESRAGALQRDAQAAKLAVGHAQGDRDMCVNRAALAEQAHAAIGSQLKELGDRLDQRLRELGFESMDEARGELAPKEVVSALSDSIDGFDNSVIKLEAVIAQIGEKLAAETKGKLGEVDDADDVAIYEDLKDQLQSKRNGFGEAKKDHILLVRHHEEMTLRYQATLEIQGQLEAVAHELGVLKDLENLFKGNRFVEFVATERLKYVSREASARLSEITGGSYGITTDDDGRFLIQDNKNGGILREPSTLSGGETFLASLALALALSAEIQLKGTAPLELFFLDEGFGTLDDQLLEVLMSSLERIHHDRLKVGIISHVESVKNRVPIKLVVTPAQAGEGGSKVKIEWS